MNDLQIALIAVGALALAAVWAYNSWTERKHRNAANRIFTGEQGDALLSEKDQPASSEVENVAAGSLFEVAERELGIHPQHRIEPRFPDEEDALAPLPFAAPVTAPVAVTPPPVAPIVNKVAALATDEAPRNVIAPETTYPTSPAKKPTNIAQSVQVRTLPSHWADSIADCIVRFSTLDPVPAKAVWASQAGWAAPIEKPMRWLAFNPTAPQGGAWCLLDSFDDARYCDWAVSLQLADRRGPVSESDVERFLNGVWHVVTEVGSSIELPSRSETVAYAEKLDRFCAEVDIQFSVYVIEASGGRFAGSKLRGVCEAAGLLLAPDGVFRAYDPDGGELFTVANFDQEAFEPDSIRSMAISALTFTLDVPRVVDGAFAFDRMLTTARQLAKTLGGALVDAQRQPLATPMIDGIRAKTLELQQRLRDGSIASGSTRALRLFS